MQIGQDFLDIYITSDVYILSQFEKDRLNKDKQDYLVFTGYDKKFFCCYKEVLYDWFVMVTEQLVINEAGTQLALSGAVWLKTFIQQMKIIKKNVFPLFVLITYLLKFSLSISRFLALSFSIYLYEFNNAKKMTFLSLFSVMK